MSRPNKSMALNKQTQKGLVDQEEMKKSMSETVAANKTQSLKNEQGQEVQLFVEGRDLVDLDFFSVSDPFCSLKTKESYLKHATWELNGETEVIDNNLNPRWLQHFTVKYIFVKDRDLCFQVYNYNDQTSRDLIGEAETSLSKLMMSPGQTMRLRLELNESKTGTKRIRNRKNRGTLIVRADKIKKTEDVIKFQISAILKSKKFLCFGVDQPFLVIERARQVLQTDEDEDNMVKVFSTLIAYDQINPWWEPTTLAMTEFCNNNKQLPLRISVYNYQNHGDPQLYGQVETTARAIEMAYQANSLELSNAKGKVTGSITFNQLLLDMRPSLLEYLNDQWQMSVSIAVDFTLSNMEITDIRSLHR